MQRAAETLANPDLSLLPSEVRVLGCLLEKQRTTPDLYPLTLNSLRLACNQSTNRDPVLDYDEEIIRDALHRLERRGLARLASGQGSRAPKYRHLLAGTLPMSEDEQSVLCVLMLRGPQTPGELKQRADRMYAFADLTAVQHTLTELIARGLAARLDRRPGQKEERFVHLLSEDLDDPLDDETVDRRANSAHGDAEDHVPTSAAEPHLLADLAERVASLERDVADLRAGQQAGQRAGAHP
jgi:uncharacterized protein